MNSRTSIYTILSFSILLLLLMSGREFSTSNDDASFPKQLERFDTALDYLLFRYNAWSGRLGIDLILPFILKSNVWFWRVANSIAATALLIGIWVLSDLQKHSTTPRRQLALPFLLLFLIFLSKGDVLEWGMFWATGSMNYLWPAAGLCLALIPYNRLLAGKIPPSYHWGLILLPGIYACYQEQTGLILITYSGFCLAIHYITERNIQYTSLTIWLIFFVNFLVLISAPGNGLRMSEEIIKYYPQFNDISFIEKAKLGINYTLLNHYFYESAKQFVLVPLLTLFLIIRSRQSNAILSLGIFSLSYTLICIVFARGLEGDFSTMLNLDIYGTISEDTAAREIQLYYLPMFLGLLSLLLLPVIWTILFGLSTSFIRLFLFYFASLFSSFLISFSPTVYASGYRVFFIPDIMIIIVTLSLLVESLHHYESHSRLFNLSYAFISLFGLIKIIKLIF